MFVKRLISGVVLVALALVVIIRGGWLLIAATAFLTLCGMQEFFGAVGLTSTELTLGKGGEGSQNRLPKVTLLSILSMAGALIYDILLVFAAEKYLLVGVIITMLMLLAVYVFAFPKYSYIDVLKAFFGMAYLALPLGCVYLTRVKPDGQILVWLIFLSSWGADTLAYCAGVLFGKHKMSPVISPKKSVEGAIGGILGAALLGLVYALVFKRPASAYAILCGCGAIISIVGDLAASGIKRENSIKDYGRLIPGHGGVLDRFDSMIFTAPVIYFLSLILL